jgi:hypothetical protein
LFCRKAPNELRFDAAGGAKDGTTVDVAAASNRVELSCEWKLMTVFGVEGLELLRDNPKH